MVALLASDTTDLVVAWGSAVSAGATTIAAVAAVAAAVVAIRTLRASKRDSRDRSRPMVGAFLEKEPHPNSRTADLVVRNYGASVAYNVEVTFDPVIANTGTRSGESSFVPLLLSRYEHPIPNLMPGVELRNLWFVGTTTDSDGILLNDEPIPDVVTATIRYSDRPDFWHKDTNRYTESFRLDMAIVRYSVSTTHTDDHLGLHKRSTRAMEQMVPAIKTLATKVSRIEGYAKPTAVRVEEEADRAEAMRAHDNLARQLLPRRSTESLDASE
ncbi:hypothetical protein [Rhodococcus sp. P14]|uniref:hypothetical protein n=1 Tax=Rhodococcus sp. P14 TaxID=450821 RepID=UPI0012F6F1E5|nr:hypothetical protein [Rhodococcus sp. P14]